jgi:hypothetical protein
VTTTIACFDLTSVAVVHLALLLNETILWERNIIIPADGNVLDVSVELPQAVNKGNPVRLRLHNHGLQLRTAVGLGAPALALCSTALPQGAQLRRTTRNQLPARETPPWNSTS